MTNEQIETAAMKYDLRAVGTKAFIAGAQWRIESVWHDKGNIPSDNINHNGCGELCLVEAVNGTVEFAQACYESDNGVYFFRSYSGIIELYNVKRWAYIKDLIPNTETR